MRQYKNWSPEFRQKSLNLTNRAKNRGWISEPTECQRCGQTEGILHLHNEDYDVTVSVLTAVFSRDRPVITEEEKKQVNDALEQICWRCHMIHHSEHRAPEQVKAYFAEIAAGKMYPPVYKHNFWILKKEHGI